MYLLCIYILFVISFFSIFFLAILINLCKFWILGRSSPLKGWLGTGIGYLGSGRGTKPDRVQGELGQCRQTYRLIFR